MQYSELEGNIGELKFYGDISEWWISGEDFSQTIATMDGKFKAIHIRTHCYGGSVFEGVLMQTAIRKCKTPIIFIIDGVAASMVTQVMSEADEVRISENAFVMVHCPTGLQHGNAKQMAETAKLLAGMEKNFSRNYARKTGKPEKEIQKWMDGADHWFTAEEAKAEGLVDTIDSPIVENIIKLEKPTEDGQEKTVFGRFAALLENEPINQQEKNENNTQMKKELIAKFNLTGVTENSTDAEIHTALQAKMDAEKEAGKSQIKEAVEAVIASVEKATGKVYEATMRTKLAHVGQTSGLETLQAMLGLNAPVATITAEQTATPAVPKVVTMMGSASASADARNAWTLNDYLEKDPEAYTKMKTEEPEKAKALESAYFKSK